MWKYCSTLKCLKIKPQKIIRIKVVVNHHKSYKIDNFHIFDAILLLLSWLWARLSFQLSHIYQEIITYDRTLEIIIHHNCQITKSTTKFIRNKIDKIDKIEVSCDKQNRSFLRSWVFVSIFLLLNNLRTFYESSIQYVSI